MPVNLDMALLNTLLNTVLLVVGVPLLVRLVRRVDSIAVRFERMEVAVVGLDGKGGLSAEVEKFREWKHDLFQPWAQNMSTRVALLEHTAGTAAEEVDSEKEARLRLERRLFERGH